MRDPKFFDNYATELARRLDLPRDTVLNMPVIELARQMADKKVSAGLTLVSESGMSGEKPA